MQRPFTTVPAIALLAGTAFTACQKAPPEPDSRENAAANTAATATQNAAPAAAPAPNPDADPVAGHFTLADATAGLTGDGPLVAKLETDKGTLDCTLYDDKAPITVANFVGLARGLRPWKSPNGQWIKKAAYDGTTFHRIIKGFMIQGGDALGNGTGEPGYVIPDEIWPGATHDRRGLICMANRGPNTNGAQFFILDASKPYLDNSYTIFGECKPDSVIVALASVPVAGERPVDPPKIQKVTVARGAKKK